MSAALDINLDEILAAPRAPVIAKLRTTHHELARLLSLGLKDVEVSRVTGYSQAWISTLKTNPMFQELLSHYMAQRDEVVVDVGRRLQGLSITAIELMQEKLLDKGDSLTMKELAQVAELGLDRTGYGKTATQVNVSVPAATLDAIKAQVKAEHSGRVLSRNSQPQLIEGTVRAADVGTELPSSDAGHPRTGDSL